MFEDLIQQIDKKTATEPLVIVGISGFAGSGKTHLANRLANHYGNSENQVIHLDNIYSPLPRGNGLFDDYDWNLLGQIINSARNGNDLDYQGVDYTGKALPQRFKAILPKVLAVEGIRLYRPSTVEHFDISVWVNCPPELALQRAKARDLQQGHDDGYMKRWDTEWGPLNQQYFDQYHPEKLASFLYEEFGD
ncbi:MAG: hypothetical protein QG553_578 [Patescibacteria group bacterium]|nr:hypothetical protein [Patescibacteria group bacterium]